MVSLLDIHALERKQRCLSLRRLNQRENSTRLEQAQSEKKAFMNNGLLPNGYAKGETNEHFKNMAALRCQPAVAVGLRDRRRQRARRKAASRNA
jgi:hypothetical protein